MKDETNGEVEVVIGLHIAICHARVYRLGGIVGRFEAKHRASSGMRRMLERHGRVGKFGP